MSRTTTRAELAEAINSMSFRDLKMFGENIMDMIADERPLDGLGWARLLSDWAESAIEYETEEKDTAAKAA